MKEIVKTEIKSCTGCNRCVRECPMEVANITYVDEDDNVKVRIDQEKCISCGRCVNACQHDARFYSDDISMFFSDLADGVPISLIVAPSVVTNIPEYKRLFTYLKRAGVKKIYDVSLGADICIWGHVRYIGQNPGVRLITQPCPVIVTYCEVYRHDLLDRLSPVQSPMACISIYMREYEGITDRIAALSPCVAKSREFEETGLAQYSVTFAEMIKYLEKNEIALPEEETGFDHYESGLGSLFPMPGGLKENIEYFMKKKLHIAKAEGFSVYEKLNKYAVTPEEFLPDLYDVLNCIEGCNVGPACSHDRNIFEIEKTMNDRKNRATAKQKREYYDSLYKEYDEKFDLTRFMRKYQPIVTSFPLITDADIEKAFKMLGKIDYEMQNVDCGACGSETCHHMARKIALNVNIPVNCIFKTMEDAKEEHANNLKAHEQLLEMEKTREADEFVRVLLDASPFGVHFWDENMNIIDCNLATLKMFNLPDKQVFLDNFFSYSPEFQPDGRTSREAGAEYIRNTFEKGYQRFEWTHRASDGEVIPCEMTLVRVKNRDKYNIAAYVFDLREQKRMMHEINDTAARLEAVVANYPGIICSANRDNELTLFDGLLLPHLVDKDLFFAGQDLNAALQKDEYKHILKRLANTFTDGAQDWSFEANDKVLHMTTTPIYDSGGDVGGIVGKIDDITEITRIQNELKAAQSTTSAMFESNPHINVLFDSSFTVIDCNPAAISFMGFETKEAMLAGFVKRMTDSIPAFQPDGRASIPMPQRFMAAAKEGQVKFETEMLLGGVRKNISVDLKRIPYGDSFAIVGYVYDLTDIHEREMELARAHELNSVQLAKLNLMVKASKIGLWDMEIVQDDPVNPENLFMWSDEFRQMLGYSDETDFPNKLGSWSDLLHPDDKERTLNAFAKHLLDKTGKTPYDLEYRLLRKTGEYSYYRASGETVRDEEGAAVRVAGALIDITEAKNILFETERHQAEAEAANKAKSSFLSTMSHEIRTPMNAILGITEIQLQDESLGQDTKIALEKIYTSGDLLLGIINDILDLSKIEAGKLELIIDKYSIASLISDTAQLNMMRIGSKPIKFELHIDENVPAYLMGDELRVKQILNNLLSNAFKYTAEGAVTLTVSSGAAESADKKTLIVNVSDTGQGMTKEQIDKLFDEYSRFNAETNRTTEGTGLGMSITNNLIHMMNGEITVESEPGKGSTFTVHLPQAASGDETLGREMAENLQQFRTSNKGQMKRVQISREPMPYGSVLIVDDVETNIYVAKGLMSPYGLKIDSADSGFNAIDKIKRGGVYDIVFMDHMMPIMDGIEATQKIRDMGYTQPIVALTANAVAGQADMFLGSGFDDYISKPIDIRQLNSVLNKLIRDKQPPEVIEAARAASETKNAPPVEGAAKPAVDPRFAEIFVRDALKVLATLEDVAEKDNYSDEENLRMYTINVHGVKSALANIGNMELSGEALKLEIAGRENNFEVLKSDTPAFISSLRAYVEELKPAEKKAGEERVDEDKAYLTERLHTIKAACEEYDESAAEDALEGLWEKTWSHPTLELLGKIAESLLHSDFDEVVAAVEEFLGAGN